jgi:signal transduction histidine kinase
MGERHAHWPGTVRWRVTLLAALTVIVVLVATGAVLVHAQRRVLTDQLDEALAADADRIAASLGSGATPRLDLAADDDAAAQVVTSDGTIVAASPGLAGAVPSSYRVVSRHVATDDGERIVRVGAPLDDVRETVGSLIAVLAITVPVVAGILAVLVWILVGRTLRPVERIRTEVAGIGSRELGRRVPQPTGRDEIARLAATMNEMLDRLDAANRQQQRFVADASHELRTPLARMRSELEVAQRTTAPGHDDEALLGSLLEEVDHLQRLTDDLLVLARVDAGAPETVAGPVDLDDIVLAEARAREASGAVVDTRRVSAAQVIGHRGELRRVVVNLLDNAVRHATAAVTLTLDEHDGVVTFVVADDGPGIPVDRRADVFERFRRIDEARTADRGGTGLGLAIARDLVERLGGGISIDGDESDGARFVVTLPATSAR